MHHLFAIVTHEFLIADKELYRLHNSDLPLHLLTSHDCMPIAKIFNVGFNCQILYDLDFDL